MHSSEWHLLCSSGLVDHERIDNCREYFDAVFSDPVFAEHYTRFSGGVKARCSTRFFPSRGCSPGCLPRARIQKSDDGGTQGARAFVTRVGWPMVAAGSLCAIGSAPAADAALVFELFGSILLPASVASSRRLALSIRADVLQYWHQGVRLYCAGR